MNALGLIYLFVCILSCIFTCGDVLNNVNNYNYNNNVQIDRIIKVPTLHNFIVSDEAVTSNQLISLRIALPQSNVPRLIELVDNISNPLHYQYGNYLSLSDLTALIQPNLNHKNELINFFKRYPGSNNCYNCVFDTVVTNDFLTANLPVYLVEQIFNTKLCYYNHKTSKRTLLRSCSRTVTIPKLINPHIDIIVGLHDFFEMRNELKQVKKLNIETSMKNTKSLSECSVGNSPELELPPHVTESLITNEFKIYCLNGQPASEASDICVEHPPRAISLTVITTSQINPHQPNTLTNTYNFKTDLTCHVSNPSGFPNVKCIVPPLLLPISFSSTLVKAYVTYEDGSVSNTSIAPIQFAAASSVTPQLINSIYSIPANLLGTNETNFQSVNEFEKQYFWTSDLTQYYSAMGLTLSKPPIIHGINDENSEWAPGNEGSLDLQLIMSAGRNISTIYWSVSKCSSHICPAIPPGDGAYLLDWALEISNSSVIPYVTSCSYGDDEIAFFNKFGDWSYVKRMEIEFAKMSSRGMSILVASGDAGVSNVGAGPNDLHPIDQYCTPFNPSYPTTSPYVTGVGATYITANTIPACAELIDGLAPYQCTPYSSLGEVAVSLSTGIGYTSGGGFSNLTFNPTPSWQKEFVDYYFNSSSKAKDFPSSNLYNRNNRGYPDIAAVGHNTFCIVGGSFTRCTGTSASTPIAAGIISLLNDELLNNNYPVLGLLNPLLYLASKYHSPSFNRIVRGYNGDGQLNPICSGIPNTCPEGFNILSNNIWNPVSGLGSINYMQLKQYVFKLAQQRANNNNNANNYNSGLQAQTNLHLNDAQFIGYSFLISLVTIVAATIISVLVRNRTCCKRTAAQDSKPLIKQVHNSSNYNSSADAGTG